MEKLEPTQLFKFFSKRGNILVPKDPELLKILDAVFPKTEFKSNEVGMRALLNRVILAVDLILLKPDDDIAITTGTMSRTKFHGMLKDQMAFLYGKGTFTSSIFAGRRIIIPFFCCLLGVRVVQTPT